MAHGGPDHGINAPSGVVDSITDIGELAARLGSIATFDRRGHVILLDDFEDDINKWERTLIGVGANARLSSHTARNGGLSCELTTGNVIGNETQIARYISYPVFSKVGLEIHFTAHVNISFVQITIIADNGTTFVGGALRYLPPTNVVQYADAGGAWVQLAAGLDLYRNIHFFTGFKVVIDLTNAVYSRALLGHNTYPMTQAGWSGASFVGASLLGIFILVGTAVNANRICYVDDAIVTQNEP